MATRWRSVSGAEGEVTGGAADLMEVPTRKVASSTTSSAVDAEEDESSSSATHGEYEGDAGPLIVDSA